jgi:hypothetical protein
MNAILSAVNACYGDLANPDFRQVYANMDGPLHRQLVDELRTNGFKITETTDQNDDVATQLVASRGTDEVGLALSGVGPFAALIQPNGKGSNRWITSANEAPSPLAALIAKTVQQKGFSLLSRDTVAHKISMSRADGSNEATLYQALFTDSDVIP